MLKKEEEWERNITKRAYKKEIKKIEIKIKQKKNKTQKGNR